MTVKEVLSVLMAQEQDVEVCIWVIPEVLVDFKQPIDRIDTSIYGEVRLIIDEV